MANLRDRSDGPSGRGGGRARVHRANEVHAQRWHGVFELPVVGVFEVRGDRSAPGVTTDRSHWRLVSTADEHAEDTQSRPRFAAKLERLYGGIAAASRRHTRGMNFTPDESEARAHFESGRAWQRLLFDNGFAGLHVSPASTADAARGLARTHLPGRNSPLSRRQLVHLGHHRHARADIDAPRHGRATR